MVVFTNEDVGILFSTMNLLYLLIGRMLKGSKGYLCQQALYLDRTGNDQRLQRYRELLIPQKLLVGRNLDEYRNEIISGTGKGHLCVYCKNGSRCGSNSELGGAHMILSKTPFECPFGR